MPTTVKIRTDVAIRVFDRIEKNTGLGINEWVASKGFTVTGRMRGPKQWEITVEETLNASQKTAFENLLDAEKPENNPDYEWS